MNPTTESEKTIISLANIPSDILFFLLDQIENNVATNEIESTLLEKGIDNIDLKLIFRELPDFIREKMENIATQLSIGILLSISGLALNILLNASEKNSAFAFIGYSLMAIGILKIIRKGLQTIKFKKILKNLNNQTDDL